MSRSQNRVTNRALELAGIQRADQGPRISDNIEMVYSMGDLAFLLAPIPGADAYHQAAEVGAVGLFSGVEIHANPDSGILITHVENLTADDVRYAVTAEELTASLTTVPADWSTPIGSSRARIVEGNAPTAVLGTELLGLASIPQAALPIKVFPGEHILLTTITANVLFRINIFWREVPTTPDTL